MITQAICGPSPPTESYSKKEITRKSPTPKSQMERRTGESKIMFIYLPLLCFYMTCGHMVLAICMRMGHIDSLKQKHFSSVCFMTGSRQTKAQEHGTCTCK